MAVSTPRCPCLGGGSTGCRRRCKMCPTLRPSMYAAASEEAAAAAAVRASLTTARAKWRCRPRSLHLSSLPCLCLCWSLLHRYPPRPTALSLPTPAGFHGCGQIVHVIAAAAAVAAAAAPSALTLWLFPRPRMPPPVLRREASMERARVLVLSPPHVSVRPP